MKKILIIIPAFNEEANILKVYQNVKDYALKSKNQIDAIIINDGSFDNTKNILEENNISHIDLIRNLGIGGAVQTGYKYALNNNYDIAIQFDGDGQHDIECLNDLINPIVNENKNMVIGSRFIGDVNDFMTTRSRRIGIKIISFFIKLKTGQKIYDTTSGFRAIDKDLIKHFANIYPIEYPEPISTVDAINNGFKISEVPVKMHPRSGGKSSINSWKNIYYMINVVLSIMVKKGK